ncbi:MAG: D-alanyl-D-alanine carboxypeptidase/D-alanyl-D-alanine-endopeptidase [Thermoflavifilum sp.]|nr:D-alanyl-D-alanine carboxypeptidase/D-alanyl-D-alanine-endopeptidase [Thermoflavifilum sp.]
MSGLLGWIFSRKKDLIRKLAALADTAAFYLKYWLAMFYLYIGMLMIQRIKQALSGFFAWSITGWMVCLVLYEAHAQSPSFLRAWQRFRQLPELRHAAIGMEVMDATNGKVVFQVQSHLGLAPASCNKVFTAAAALEQLGPGYRYKTLLAYSGSIQQQVLEGNLYLIGSGDPTLGSWRYPATTTESIGTRWLQVLRRAGIRSIRGNVVGVDTIYSTQMIPGGWVWEDIGNYYGAGCAALNWHENQFDIALQPGEHVGDPARLMGMKHAPYATPDGKPLQVVNELLTGEAGSGDQAYVYFDLTRPILFLRGTVPLDASPDFSISASVPDPAAYAAQQFRDTLLQAGIDVQGKALAVHLHDTLPAALTVLDTFYSPPLDSIVYWFLHRSINLYGEALALSLSHQQHHPATIQTGVEMIHQFCIQLGLDATAVNTVDGSGLSPANRVTAHALASLLFRIQHRPWFSDFYEALPVIHNIRMKDGYIAGVRSYAGYLQDRSGKKWIFAFIVNNFTGSSLNVRNAMWDVLDALKQSQGLK